VDEVVVNVLVVVVDVTVVPVVVAVGVVVAVVVVVLVIEQNPQVRSHSCFRGQSGQNRSSHNVQELHCSQ